jgi:cytoskeletal protein CcmA (bactofilin family)
MRISRDSKEKSTSAKLDTYIGEQTSFQGSLVSKDNLTIYGNIKGTIECQGRVVVGETGSLEADIIATDVVISGKVIGNVTAKDKLELAPTGVLNGDIKTTRLVIEEGSKFEGHSEMLSKAKPAALEKAGSKESAHILEAQEQPKLPKASSKK